MKIATMRKPANVRGEPDLEKKATMHSKEWDELAALEIDLEVHLDGKKLPGGKVKLERDLFWNPDTTLKDVMDGKTR